MKHKLKVLVLIVRYAIETWFKNEHVIYTWRIDGLMRVVSKMKYVFYSSLSFWNSCKGCRYGTEF